MVVSHVHCLKALENVDSLTRWGNLNLTPQVLSHDSNQRSQTSTEPWSMDF
jgi:hypothetical protein